MLTPFPGRTIRITRRGEEVGWEALYAHIGLAAKPLQAEVVIQDDPDIDLEEIDRLMREVPGHERSA